MRLHTLEEGLVFLDLADMRAALLQIGDRREPGPRDVVLEDALERLVARPAHRHHAHCGTLDVGFGVGAWQIGHPVKGFLAAAAISQEDVAAKREALRPELFGLRQQAHRFA